MILEITDNNFEEMVLHQDKAVILYFWANWNGPSKVMGPTFAELSEDPDFDGLAVFGSVDVDGDTTGIVRDCGVSSIPAFLCFKDGGVRARVVGVKYKGDLARILLNGIYAS